MMCTTCGAWVVLYTGCVLADMSTEAGIRAVVEGSVDIRLSNFQAWPKNMLRLELECLEKKQEDAVVEGVYQDKTGNILQQLKRAGEITEFKEEINSTEHSFIANPGCSEVSGDVKQRFKRVDEFLEKSGHFGSLVAYVALCKVWNELSDTNVDVMPEGSYSVLHHTERNPDSFVVYPNEYIPVEVYNGRDYLDTAGGGYQSNKHEQLQDYANVPEGHELQCNPFLICRRSTDDLRGALRQWDGMGVDTDCIVACENRQDEIEDDLEFFDIRESVEFIPEIKSPNGTMIDGEDYQNASSSSSLLRPTSAIGENTTEIPSFYMERVRGGVQLHYVNSYYRRRHDVSSIHACRVVQTIYNQLLRQGGKDRDTAISDGWDSTHFFDSIPSRQEKIIKEEANSIINNLASKRVIFQRGGKIYARKAEHPQQGLRFDV
jgi:predicted acetyltransferase